MTAKSFACVADARIHSTGLGAGKSDYTPVGLWNVGLNGVYRGLMKFATPDWAGLGIRRITAATLRIRNSPQNYVARGGTPRMLVKRCTSNWSEGSAESLSGSNAVTYGNQPGTTSTGQTDTGTMSTVDGTWINLDVLAIVRAWAPKTVENGGGLPNYGFALHSFDEGSTARTTEFYARETSSDPVLILSYETNTAPSAPTNLTPATASDGSAAILPVYHILGSGTVAQRGSWADFAATRVDADAGDYITGSEVQVFADAATDAVPGSALIDTIKTDYTGSPTAFVAAIDVSGLTIGTTYRHRIRTRDKEQQWGAWSSLLNGRFIPNTIPKLSNLTVDTGSATPNFYGTLVDPDPSAAFSEATIEVAQDTTAGTLYKWQSGGIATAGTRFVIAYAGGQQLEYGVTYKWRTKIKDNVGSESVWSNWRSFTPRQVIGPDNMTPRTIETKQATLTPTLTIAHSVAFTAYELEVAKYGDGTTVLWDVPVTAVASTTSIARVYAGLTLDWGRIVWWRAKILVGGTTWSEWSPWYPFYINARPDAPIVTVDTAVDSGNSVTDSTNAAWRYQAVVGVTPTIRAPFTDDDRTKGYTDNPTRRAIEIRNAITGAHVAGSPFVITVGITDTFVVGGGALTAGTVYKTRAQYDDGASQRSDWSPYTYFKPVTALTITAGTAPAGADPSPTFAWTLGRAQKALRVLVKNNGTGEIVHDSGLVVSATTSYTMPGRILQTGVTYAYQVTAYDTDLIAATLAYATWTTAFTAPAPLASLTATPDLDRSAINLAWDVGYAGLVLALGPLAYWRLGDGAGVTAADSGPNNRPGTLVASPTVGVAGAVVGDADTAMTFNGSTQIITVPDNAVFNLANGARTYVVWVKRSATQGALQTLLSKRTAGFVRFNAANRIEWADDAAILHTGNAVITDTSQWHMIAVTYAGANGLVSLYIDGVLDSSSTPVSNLADSTQAWSIAATSVAATSPFPGSLDEIAVYGRALTPAEVASLYGRGSASHFWRYLVSRRDAGTGAFEPIAALADPATPSYIDPEAPHGVTVEYAVTIDNGWAESDAVTASALVDLQWWIANPLDAATTFELRWFDGFRDAEEYQQESFQPLGRPTPIVVSGELMPSAGSFSLRLLPGDPDNLRSLLRRAAQAEPWVVLKSPFGDTYRVKLGSISRDLDFYGAAVISMGYITVA